MIFVCIGINNKKVTFLLFFKSFLIYLCLAYEDKSVVSATLKYRNVLVYSLTKNPPDFFTTGISAVRSRLRGPLCLFVVGPLAEPFVG